MSYLFTLHAVRASLPPLGVVSAPVILAQAVTATPNESDQRFVANRFTPAIVSALAFAQEVIGDHETLAEFLVEVRRKEFEDTTRELLTRPPLAREFVTAAVGEDWPRDTMIGASYWSIDKNVRAALRQIVRNAGLDSTDFQSGFPAGALVEIVKP